MLKKIFQNFTRSEKIVFLITALLAIGSAAALIAIGIQTSTRMVPASGGEYVEGAVGQPIYVNPVIASNAIDKSLVRLVFSNLHDLAEKIDASPDGRTWKVRLKDNARWQDGEKLTSDDVIFTVQKIQDPTASSPLSNLWQGVAVQRLSELELQFSLVNPYAFFNDTLNGLYIIPKHLFSETPPANWRLSDYNLKPVGSGPYKFTDYSKRTDGFIATYKLEAWGNYLGNKALIQNFDFQFFSRTDDLVKNFNAGGIDGIAGLLPENLADVARPYELLPYKLPSYYAVFLNQSKSVPLKDAAVRQTLQLLTDPNILVQKALGGHGTAAVGPIPEGTQYFDQNLLTAPASPSTTSLLAQASATLDSAGWKLDSDGIRKKTIGTEKVPLELTLTVPQIDFLVTTANLLRDAWQGAGFKVNLNIELPDDVASAAIKNRDYEMLLFGNVLGGSYDLYSFWHSSQRFYPGLNLALYNSKDADNLIESIRQNLDSAKRAAQFQTLQTTITNDMPAIFLYTPDFLYIANKNLHGAEGGLIAEPADIFAGSNQWYLRTARVLK